MTLAARNNTLFFSTLDNELLVSSDSGRTVEDIAASLSPARIAAIELTNELIVIGTDISGVWTRRLTEIVAPYVRAYSTVGSNQFLIGAEIFIETDQHLFSNEGTSLSDLTSYISVAKAGGVSVSYSAKIDVEKKLITISIPDAVEGERYTVLIHPVYNELGLPSRELTQTFTATMNHSPNLQETSVQASQGQALSLPTEIFSAAFADVDGDPLLKLMVKGLPSHGALKLDDTPVLIHQEIPATSLSGLTYTPDNTFSGKDYWFWNGSDGIDYAAVDVKMTIDVAPVTSVWKETSEIRLYPNPVSSTLKIDPADDHSVTVDIVDMFGAPVIDKISQNEHQQSPLEINLAGLPPGIYAVRVQSSSGRMFQHKIIKK